MKLFYYDHCPFCVRAEMAAGYKQVPIEKIILLNDDAQTCLKLVNAKQVPILEFDDGSAMPESLDIAHKCDEIGNADRIITAATDKQKSVTDHIATVSKSISALLYPRNVKAGLPEFATASAIAYFQEKKEKSLGKTFDQALAETAEHKKNVEAMLATLPITSLSAQNTMSWDDIMIFPTLRNLTIVRDLEIPAFINDYLQHISSLTGVKLYFDRAL